MVGLVVVRFALGIAGGSAIGVHAHAYAHAYAHAFPSVGHAFLFQAMGRCGIPGGAVACLRNLCMASTFVVAGASGTQPFTRITCGVLQGSPLSGLVFVLMMDWILEQFSRALDPVGGLLRACADGIGDVLRALEHAAAG